eukprot:CAMPEP_0114299448 /NCGR_PEP_ID=MMETSP0059-20121206/12979_1 /TAXON_ID=36894 /ORGANISM="Pyramimonas parkeae, Strain CCMP726" /LENGTH=798 /DNA_ID=CAMNT_0001421921 /DNA_START=64 /DNA_END=2460 /DNA_ORIENTATION=+
MSVVDLATFSEKDFDAKAWVNGACTSKPAEENLEKYLAELEMKLQLLAEDIAVSLEDHSTQALQRVPRALGEVARVKADGESMQGAVNGLLQKLMEAQASSQNSVQLLSEVDAVKRRLESAKETMGEASGLAELMESVEDVFAGTDLKLMASTLVRMRRGLKVVGSVPEFNNGRERVAALEDRLESVVGPALAEALGSHDASKAQELCDILVAIGRYSALEKQYIVSRMKPLAGLWEQYEASEFESFVDWLPSFYDAAILHLQQEARWCVSVFPEHHSQMLVQLMNSLLERTQDSYVKRLHDTLAEAQASAFQEEVDTSEAAAIASGGSLLALLAAHAAASTFTRGLKEVLTGIGAQGEAVQKVLARAFAPFEQHKAKYGEVERRQLATEVAAIDFSMGPDLDDTIHRMSVAVPGVASLLEVAVDRCIAFTSGTEVEALLSALDQVVLQFVAALSGVLAQMRTHFRLAPEPNSQAASAAEEGEDAVPKEERDANDEGGASGVEDGSEHVQSALQLLSISGGLLAQLGSFEATLRNTLIELGTRLATVHRVLESGDEAGILSASIAGLEAAYIRLHPNPDKARRLVALLEQASDARFHALPRATPRAASFQDDIHTLVYDVLMSKVRAHVHNLGSRAHWSATDSSTTFDLPSFSAYPQEYVTTVGEYLLTLPQQLESLSAGSGQDNREGDEADDVAFFASSWLTKVALGTAEMYLEQLLRIETLSDKGAQQAAADLEYLCNVYAALGETVPTPLITFMQCSVTMRDAFTDMVKAEGPALDSKVVDKVAKMRGIVSAPGV